MLPSWRIAAAAVSLPLVGFLPPLDLAPVVFVICNESRYADDDMLRVILVDMSRSNKMK